MHQSCADEVGHSLEQAIARVTHHAEADERANRILAAAVSLRESTGRDRKVAIRTIVKKDENDKF